MSDWPFSGRQAEHHRLQTWLTDGGCPGVFLAGAAGVGKSRLAEEFRRSAERAGWSTAAVRATRSSTALPFGALEPLFPGGRRSAADLVAGPAGRGLVLLVDDAHWLDDSSATLVYQLAASGAAFVVVTVCPDQTAPDAVVALWKEGIVPRLELEALDQDGIDQLLRRALGGPVDRATVVDLARRCQGNLLFLRELVVGAVAAGVLRDEGGLWTAVDPIAPSPRIVELVEARLAGLGPAERDILELTSLAEPLGPAELARVSDLEAAGALERRGLLRSRLDGRRLRIGLAHPLYGEVLRRQLPPVAARRLAQLLAGVVEGTGARRREDVLRIGTWRLESGGGRPDVMLAAADTARWRFDYPLAERLATAAAQGGAGFEADLLAAESRVLQGGAAAANDALRLLATRADTDDRRARVALARLDNDAFFTGRMDDALTVAEEAEAALDDPEWRGAVAARRCAILLATRGPRAAAEHALPLIPVSSGRALAWSRVIASFSVGRLGRLEEAAQLARDGAVADVRDQHRWYHLFTLGETLAQAGEFPEAAAIATREYQRALDERSGEAQAYFAWQLAKTVGERGHVEDSIRLGREAVSLFRRTGRRTTVQDALTHLLLALALAGRTDEAVATAGDIDALDRPAAGWSAVDLWQARAWTAVAAGDLPGARDLLTRGAGIGEDIGDLVGAAAALHGLARLGRPAEVAGRLEQLAAGIEGGLVAARARHAGALARHDPLGLTGTAQAFEAMGATLLAAEASADAAMAWHRTGDLRAAAAAQRRASLLSASCAGTTTPALRTVGLQVRLTAAERDTALLAAAGKSNREIADALLLSVRTVEGRLQRVYEKLGVSRRSELATALR